MSKVRKTQKKLQRKDSKIKKRWFTKEGMAWKLGWSKCLGLDLSCTPSLRQYITHAVKYCEKHNLHKLLVWHQHDVPLAHLLRPPKER